MGYGELGANMLRGVAPHHDVVLVVTHPAGFTGLRESDVERSAAELGIPVEFSRSAREPHLHARLHTLRPQVVLSTNWRTRIPSDVLSVPTLGAVNVHDALLPEYAGFGAVNWAVRNGEDATGLTVHYMDEELDTGPIIHRSVVKIGPHDTATDVLATLLEEYVPVTLQALDLVQEGNRGERQTGDGRSFYHRIGVADTRIDWAATSATVYNLIRGQSDPFVNAWTTHDGHRLWVKSAVLPQRSYGGTPGRIVRAEGDGVAVVTGRSCTGEPQGVVIRDVAVDDREPVRALDYFEKFDGYLV